MPLTHTDTDLVLAAIADTARSAEAFRHFDDRLRYETDAADLATAVAAGAPGIVVIDTRSASAFAAGHVPGARNLPAGKMTERRTAELDRSAVHVTYCSGPHCNGSTKAARRLAELGIPAKELIGGWWGWLENGSPVET